MLSSNLILESFPRDIPRHLHRNVWLGNSGATLWLVGTTRLGDFYQLLCQMWAVLGRCKCQDVFNVSWLVNFYMSSTCLQKIQTHSQFVIFWCGTGADDITNTVSKPYINNSGMWLWADFNLVNVLLIHPNSNDLPQPYLPFFPAPAAAGWTGSESGTGDGDCTTGQLLPFT